MEPYEYMDPDDRKLTIWPRNASASTDALARICDGDEATITVKQSAVREITGKLYEACGLPSPVILERPEFNPGRSLDRIGDVQVGRLDGKVTVGLYQIQPETLTPAYARELAALIALHADQAEAEPDPEEVDALAEAIRAELYTDSSRVGLRPSESDVASARIALRWIKAREKRDV
jgi:hypothetical protein